MVWALGGSELNVDAQAALAWGDELAGGGRPALDAPGSPTPHPLANLLGLLHAPLGTHAAAQVWIAGCLAAFAGCGLLIYRLGALWAGPAAGVLAAAVFLTRPEILSFAARGYLDLPYLALVLAALHSFTRGDHERVSPLLVAAGLLRPEAWLFAAAYAAWRAASGLTWVGTAALAAAAPVLWAAADWLLTGDPLNALHVTQANTQELGRATGPEGAALSIPGRIAATLGPAAALLVAVGSFGALRHDAGRRALPALGLALAASTLVALAGMPVIMRYLLPATALLAIVGAAGVAAAAAHYAPRQMQGRRLALGATMLALAALLPNAAADAATVSGKVTGKVPARAGAGTSLEVVSYDGGNVVAAKTVPRSGAFSFTLPAGVYLLKASVTPRRGRAAAPVYVPFSLKEGQRRRNVLIAAPRSVVRAGARAGYTQVFGNVTPGKVAYAIEDFSGATGPDLSHMNRGLTDLLKTDTFQGTKCRAASVAAGRDLVALQAEARLQRSRYIDPSTRVRPNFIQRDIQVRGRLATLGGGARLGYTLTLVDARSGKVLETVKGSLDATDGKRFFDQAEELGKRLAKRVCDYGEVYEVSLAGTGRGVFATHNASGNLAAEKLLLKPTARDKDGPTKWTGPAGKLVWTDIVATPKIDCTYGSPVSDNTWTTQLDRLADGQLRVNWFYTSGGGASLTVSCPDAPPVPGQPATSLINVAPTMFALPGTGVQAITGGVTDGGDGFFNDLKLKVRTVGVVKLG